MSGNNENKPRNTDERKNYVEANLSIDEANVEKVKMGAKKIWVGVKRGFVWAFYIVMTVGVGGNFYGYKIVKQDNQAAIEAQNQAVVKLQGDVEACKKINEENASLKITLGDLIDKLDAFLKKPRSWRTREQLDETILKAKIQIGKPISQNNSVAGGSLFGSAK